MSSTVDDKISYYEIFLAFLPVFNSILIFLETVDGPNQHTGAEIIYNEESIFNKIHYNYSNYNESLTEDEYYSPKYAWLPSAQVKQSKIIHL